MNKGGISAVVATVLIILITVAAITIVWMNIIPMVKDNLVFEDLEGVVEIVTSGGYTVYDAEREIAIVQVQRDVDDLDVCGIRVLFSINGSSYGSSVVAPDSGQTRVYNFNLSSYGRPNSVSVIPLVIRGGQEKEGAITSEVDISSKKIYKINGSVYELGQDYSVCGPSVNCSFTPAGNIDDGDSASGVWGDGTYIYLANWGGGLRAYTHDGTNFSHAGSTIAVGGNVQDVWGDGEYIYIANKNAGLRAYTFDGTDFVLVDSIDDGDEAYRVWCDGTYIYLANSWGGLRAYTFNGTNFLQAGNIETGDLASEAAWDVWGDGTYIYLANWGGGLRAYTHDGTNFIQVGYIGGFGYSAYSVWGNEDYVYLANWNQGLKAYTFDGTDFTEAGQVDNGGRASDVWGDENYIYSLNDLGGIRAYTHDGTDFTEAGQVDNGGHASDLWGDGDYVYVARGREGLMAYKC